MMKLLAVASGGAIGSIGRYLLSLTAEKIAGLNFPAGTFAVNIIGSLLIGLCWSYFDRIHISNEFRLFVFTGFLGGFTTFSTFTRESAQFIKAGEPSYAAFYLIISNIIGLAAVFLGFYLSHKILR
jgi:CrcB protein